MEEDKRTWKWKIHYEITYIFHENSWDRNCCVPKAFSALSHFAFSWYMHALHLSWRFSKMHMKKKGEKGKSALDALSLSTFPVQYMIGNSLHLCKTKTLSTLTQKRFSKKVKRPWKWWQCFAFLGAWYDAAINTHRTVLQTNLMGDCWLQFLNI